MGEERSTPEALRGLSAVGLLAVPEVRGGGFAVEAEEAELERLAESVGLDLKRCFAERGPLMGISERPEVVAAIEALRTGQAKVILTNGPSAVGPTVGGYQWFFTQVVEAGGVWWMGGESVVQGQGDASISLEERLQRFREEVEEA